MPRFSVIVPVYKVEKYIKLCIESILNQSFKDFEVLVVDDCGGDNSIPIVEEYAKKDDRIKIFYHKKNRGLSAARNTALDNATGKYIVCLDSDDWMEPNCLDVLNAEFKLRKTESIWFNARRYIEKEKTPYNRPLYNQEEEYKIVTPENITSLPNYTWIKAYTRESIQKYNLHWPEGLTFEDMEFHFEYFTLNPKTYVINDCLINYRHRGGSITREAESGNIKLNDFFIVLEHLRNFWIEQGVYEDYKITMVEMLQRRARLCYTYNYSPENRKLVYKFFEKLGYPKDFQKQKPEHKQNTPLVSIVVPYYNVESYISECLDSIINQTYRNLEILCIDDCGQDNSSKIVEEYAKKDSRIKIIRHEKSKGAGGARNTGIEQSTGKYMFFVDADDYLVEDCVYSAVKILEEHNLNVVFFKSEIFVDDIKIRYPIINYPKYRYWADGPFRLDEDNLCDMPSQCWNKGYRRSFLIDNNIRMPENIYYQDVEFHVRMFTKSHDTYMIDRPLYLYRKRGDSSMDCVYNKTTIKAEDLYIAHERIYDFLVKNNLIEKYKNSFLELVMICLNNFRENNYNLCKKCTPRMLQFLNYIGFPEKYRD